MELSDNEKERIQAEEKFRWEVRKGLMKERLGMGGPWGHGCGCRGGACSCGRGHFLFKALLLGLVIFAVCHFWHRSCAYGPNGYYPAPPTASAPTVQPPVKN